MSLIPYTGSWTKEEASHLLRRTIFGATNQQITDVVNMSMTTAVNQLLTLESVTPPLSFDVGETIANQGETWVNLVYPANPTANQLCENARYKSLAYWTMMNLNNQGLNINQKMLFFWHNHFGVTPSADARAAYTYFELIRSNALGNIKQLIKDVTVDPSMLVFLNGNTNSVQNPNENYAREVLELFTIGKGDQIATGDYSNYTELDVAEGSKILTGYVVQGIRSSTLTSAQSLFFNPLHDTSTKQLSYHFGNAPITNGGNTEYSNYLDVIFQQDQVATHICTKLYRFFVNYDITPFVETSIIPEMAQTMISNNYEVLPVLVELFTSEHFYDVALRGTIIRNPLETMFCMLNATETHPNVDLITDANIYLTLYFANQNMGLDMAVPPSVSGWTAYYQAPAFSRLWLNSTTIKFRFDLAQALLFSGIVINGYTFKIDCLPFLNNLSMPSVASDVINDICTLFFAKPLDSSSISMLINILTANLPEFEWTIQYNDYLNDPTNPVFADPVRQRVELVLNRVCKMPQFQMI